MAVSVPTRGKDWLAAQLTREARPLLIAWDAADSTTRLLLRPLTLPAVAVSVMGFGSGLLRVTVARAVPLFHASAAGVTVTDWPSLLVQGHGTAVVGDDVAIRVLGGQRHGEAVTRAGRARGADGERGRGGGADRDGTAGLLDRTGAGHQGHVAVGRVEGDGDRRRTVAHGDGRGQTMEGLTITAGERDGTVVAGDRVAEADPGP